MNNNVHLIAEVGSNHNGSVAIAKQYLQAAQSAGADSVKLQTLHKETLMSPKTLIEGKVQDYPIWELFQCNSLSDDDHQLLFDFARDEGINLFSAPFYLEAVDLLERLDCPMYKIASGDIRFTPLLERVGATGKKVILSTGASDLKDVESALRELTDAGAAEVVLLHCVANYPPQWHEANLRAMQTLKQEFGTQVGLSDHTPGALLPIAAVGMGATYIEKHVTFDKRLPGPDHPFALTFNEFGNMVDQIRTLEQAMGDGIKKPSDAEQEKQWRLRRAPYEPESREPSTNGEGIWLRPDYRLNPTNQ